MTKKYQISVPEPCHEDWNSMTPEQSGRFCNSCSKSVVDFTKMLPQAVQEFFIANTDEKICGRFQLKQLDTITIQIPTQVLFSQVNFHKMFLLALFVCMGTTLFSCKQENGVKQKIEKVELVKDSTKLNSTILGMKLPSKNLDTVNQVPTVSSTPKQTKKIKSIKITKKDSIIEPIIVGKPMRVETKIEEEIYMGGIAICTNPEFEGGMESFKNYIKTNFKFPEKVGNVNDTIQASFVINRNGILTDAQLLKDTDNEMGKQLIQLLKKSKKWTSGTQNGKLTSNMLSITLYIKTEILKKSVFRTKHYTTIDSIVVKY